MLAAVILLTPLGGLAAAAGVLSFAAGIFAYRRVRAVRDALGLAAPRHGPDVVTFAALAATFVLVGVAAAQPALSHDTAQRVRKDAAALFVLDTSRSMAASVGPTELTRLARAKSAAMALRAAIPDVESGVSTLTDRVLPNLLPVADTASFDATVERAVGIEQPPPRSTGLRATTYGVLGAIPAAGFFAASAKHRAIVLLTDGESRPFDPGALGRALDGIGVVIVRFWDRHESVFEASGRPEVAYRPDPSAPAVLDALAAATGGRVFGEADLGRASRQLRMLFGRGPTTPTLARAHRETSLAPYAALGALAPLAFLLWRPSIRRAPRQPGVREPS
jgi:hypothetical protein